MDTNNKPTTTCQQLNKYLNNITLPLPNIIYTAYKDYFHTFCDQFVKSSWRTVYRISIISLVHPSFFRKKKRLLGGEAFFAILEAVYKTRKGFYFWKGTPLFNKSRCVKWVFKIYMMQTEWKIFTCSYISVFFVNFLNYLRPLGPVCTKFPVSKRNCRDL